jgi:hypothetical protein
MDKASLKQALERLHRDLADSTEVDPELKELLGTLDDDIHQLLEDDTDGHTQGLVERAESLAARFRADHPRLEPIFREVIDTLGRIGV